MLKNIFIFILNLYIITAFFHNSNFFYKSKYKLKLTKNKYKTLKYLNNTKLNSYYCKWYYNESKNNYYNYINYTIYNKLYFKKNLYTYLHLIDQYTKIFVSNNFNHTYNIILFIHDIIIYVLILKFIIIILLINYIQSL